MQQNFAVQLLTTKSKANTSCYILKQFATCWHILAHYAAEICALVELAYKYVILCCIFHCVSWAESAKILPDSPFTPVAPICPSVPASPVAPLRPTGPVLPVLPVNPREPVNPGWPVDPRGPGIPWRPIKPGTPGAPTAPVKPLLPTGPRLPVAPIGPVLPTRPTHNQQQIFILVHCSHPSNKQQLYFPVTNN